MKNLTAFLIILISLNSFAQLPQFEVTRTSIEPIVVEIEGATPEEMYSKTLEWIQTYYANPNEVLKAQILDKEIRIKGYSERAWKVSVAYMDVSYYFTVKFKDGRYQASYDVVAFFGNSDHKKVYYSYPVFFKKDGSLRKMYSKSKVDFEASINAISYSLYKYLTGATQEKEEEW